MRKKKNKNNTINIDINIDGGLTYFESPIGNIAISCVDNYITSLKFGDITQEAFNEDMEVLIECKNELKNYFLGNIKSFSVPYKNNGTDFFKKVWQNLKDIPYGTTTSYKEIAKKIENPNGTRAVGLANSRNNIWIIVPCHRVIAHNGNLSGYSGEVWRKEWLINHEKKYK
ncbi:MAG: methylated-DNA--[protein]-cysteine S-methyltransferase [Defluviitaleaceae bacterium]|nr:methylated-DNA--[protein]-cysteine S-methyltransferase [Defluviitaleaceae bacterium]